MSAVAVAPTAHADCPYGTTACGAEYCADAGYECCAHVGRPDISCAAGTSCTASGCVSDYTEPEPEPDPGDSCPGGSQACGSNYCSPSGWQCCAHVGRPDISCEPGSTCTASGCETSGYTEPDPNDTCPGDSQPCGSNYCAPLGWECCAHVGRPDLSCESGSTCTAGGCQSYGDEDPDQEGCPSGTSQCGEDYCAATGTQCCAHVGRPDISCRSGSYCDSTGCLSDADDSPVEPSDMYEPGPVGPGTTQDGDYTCSSQSADSCTVRFCLRSDFEDCYYEVDGEQVGCDACTDSDAISACARRAVDVCTDGSAEAETPFSACSAGRGNPAADSSWILLALAMLWRRRRAAA